MNICFLSPHTRISGGVKVIFRLANRLQRKGCKVTVLTEKYNDKNMFWFGEKILFRIEKASRNSFEILQPNIVINYGDGNTNLPLSDKVKHILLLQGIPSGSLVEQNLKYSFHAVIAVSNWLAQAAKKFGHKNVFVVHPGIDVIFQPIKEVKNDVPLIGTLFHKHPEKKFKFFVETVKLLSIKYNFKLKTLLLSAQTVSNLDELDAYSIANSLLYNPPQFYLPYMYSTCNAWLSPAIKEGFGLTTLEAMACGCPVVTVKNCGLDDYLVHDRNCMIVQTLEEAAEALRRVIYDERLRNKLAYNGIQLAKNFSWKNASEQFYSIIRKLMS